MSHMTETGVKSMIGRMNAGYEIIGQWPATEDGGKVVVLGHKKEGYTPYVLWTVFPSADTNPGGEHENMEAYHWGHYHMDFESAMEGLKGKLPPALERGISVPNRSFPASSKEAK